MIRSFRFWDGTGSLVITGFIIAETAAHCNGGVLGKIQLSVAAVAEKNIEKAVTFCVAETSDT
ncbi:MAG: hypothetical protein IJX93_11530 [Clostridia bacterium]|nr:hypothetical protein [Clostridia bacterium]MBQ8368845.1 hypothetical protein [Clostridia bacterium]